MTLMRQPPAPVVPELVEPWGDNDLEDPPVPAPVPGRAGMRLETQVVMDGRQVKVAVWGPDDADVQARLAAVLAQHPVPAKLPAQPTDDTPQCPTHGALKRSTKGKGWYCPNKLDDESWCPSKGKGVRA